MAIVTIPLERISAEARQINLAKVLLTILLTVPYVLGWVARKTWLFLAFLWSATKLGWRDAGSPKTTEAGTDERS